MDFGLKEKKLGIQKGKSVILIPPTINNKPELEKINFRENLPKTIPESSGKCDEIKFLPENVRNLLANHRYKIVDYIDSGSTSVVYKVMRSDKVFAAKIVEYEKLSPIVREYFLPNELKIVRLINNPFIVRTEEIIKNDDFAIIINELASDGDLIGFIEKISKPNLTLAKQWIAQIVQAIVYLHSLGIAHRDIKADNVLICRGIAKLCDFGYAEISLDPITKKVIPCTTFCGTLEYKAPEILFCNQPFNPFIADMFSLGVLIYTLVTLEFPFGSGSHLRSPKALKQLYQDIQEKRWLMTKEIETDRQLCSLLKQLLNPNIEERITAMQVLCHPWLFQSGLVDPRVFGTFIVNKNLS